MISESNKVEINIENIINSYKNDKDIIVKLEKQKKNIDDIINMYKNKIYHDNNKNRLDNYLKKKMITQQEFNELEKIKISINFPLPKN